MKAGRLDDALREYQVAVASDPANAEARANLGLLLLGSREADKALAEVQEALRLDQGRLILMGPFVWLLATHPDPDTRRPAQALQLAERIVEATARTDAGALDLLAACYAAMGRFEDALTIAKSAQKAVRGPRSDQDRAAIEDHMQRYRRGEMLTMIR